MRVSFIQADPSSTTRSKAGRAATKSPPTSRSSSTYRAARGRSTRTKSRQSRRSLRKMSRPLRWSSIRRRGRKSSRLDLPQMRILLSFRDMFSLVLLRVCSRLLRMLPIRLIIQPKVAIFESLLAGVYKIYLGLLKFTFSIQFNIF